MTQEVYTPDHFAHVGTPRHSGRYPWGSGGNAPASTRNRDFTQYNKMLKDKGLDEKARAKAMGYTINELRAHVSIEKEKRKEADYQQIRRLREKGMSFADISKQMGRPDRTLRGIYARSEADNKDVVQATADMLRKEVDKKKYVDVGKGVEHQLAVPKERMKTALEVLKIEGYPVYKIFVPQSNLQDAYTSMNVLAKKGITEAEVRANKDKVQQIQPRSEDYGRSYIAFQPPLSISSRRIGINYKGQGGEKADGVIYVRPGVPDVRIGEKRYGQVRIMVDNTHFLKGMAVYKDDLPPGKDLVFNTKKDPTGRKKDAMKPIENDPELPFGSIVRQHHDPKTGKVNSAMNMVGSPTKEGSGEAGQWDKWSRNLSSQFLSKQKPELAKQQLDLTYDRRKREFAEINSLTNPTVRKDLLNKFADSVDADAAQLKAASLPRQATKVILPISSMKPTEVYAPTFRDGEKVILVRHPHGGTFEIPQLTVNNKNLEARKIIGTAATDPDHDAIGIHFKVAERLSGADFDGDTVLIIPIRGHKFTVDDPLEGLKGFDPMKYKIPEGSNIKVMSSKVKQQEMGNISNLITDMTIQGAPREDLAPAIRHSMVVIDAENHKLNYKQSAIDNGIPGLKEKYQGGKGAGARTFISRAGGEQHIEQRQPRPARLGGPVDPITGRKVYTPTGKMRPEVKTRTVNKVKEKYETGVMVPKTRKHERLAIADDAYEVFLPNYTPTPKEVLYADHANRMKAMANEARKTAYPVKGEKKSPSAEKVYHNEVESLNAKLRNAERNAPYERQAQVIASVQVSQRRQSNPNIDKDELKKIKTKALNEARVRTGANKHKILLTQKEWDAIQAGAIAPTKVATILNNTDTDRVKQLALPRSSHPILSPSMLRTAKGMADRGYTQAEIADRLGIGVTTLKVGLSQ
jgi:lambda repressor-like predicted transcriptional regulator